MKVHRDSLEEIERAVKKYESVYNVVVIGKVVKGKVVEEANGETPAKKPAKMCVKACKASKAVGTFLSQFRNKAE